MKNTINEIATANAGLGHIVFKTTFYAITLMFTMWLSTFFVDFYTTNLCLFTVVVVGFELFWNKNHSPSPGRMCALVLVVIGLWLSGLVLVGHAAAVAGIVR